MLLVWETFPAEVLQIQCLDFYEFMQGTHSATYRAGTRNPRPHRTAPPHCISRHPNDPTAAFIVRLSNSRLNHCTCQQNSNDSALVRNLQSSTPTISFNWQVLHVQRVPNETHEVICWRMQHKFLLSLRFSLFLSSSDFS